MRRIICTISLVLIITGCASHSPQLKSTTHHYYLVRAGDNMYSIAFAHETTAEILGGLNPWLNPENIKPGMRLRLPPGLSTGRYQGNTLTLRNGYIWPVESIDISSTFGPRRGKLHSGIDIRAPQGSSIYASASGKIVFSGSLNGYGRMIVADHGRGIETVYAHNSRNMVREGQLVEQGQVIATVGRSGNATGYHLHFEYRRQGKAVDPIQFVTAKD